MKEITFEEFREAYHTIMAYIDNKPNSRPLFHALVSYHISIIDAE
jgi:hypothetical protein